MCKLRKIISIILVLSIIFSFIPNFPNNTYAATIATNIHIDSYSNGTLTFHWDPVAGSQAVQVTYHTPPNITESVVSAADPNNTYTITGLQSDYIYDIGVNVYDDANAIGNLIGQGFAYFLPNVTFYSSKVLQQCEAISGGGYEIGTVPVLDIKWKMPKVWLSDSNSFEYVNTPIVNTAMQNNINNVYNSGVDISNINFKINISNDSANIASSSSLSSISIEQQDSNYIASVSNNPATFVSVHNINASGFLDFNLIGRQDLNTAVPEANDFLLPDGDILPGTVYFMSMKLIFKNSSDVSVPIISVGDPSNLNSSYLSGSTQYTYTPPRFQLASDSSGNIYATIFQINQGSLAMPQLRYEIQSSDDYTLIGDWPVLKTIDTTFFTSGSDSTIVVISGVNQFNEMYYKIVAKDNTGIDRLESSYMPYTPSGDVSKPSVPQNIVATNVSLVSMNNVVDGNSIIEKSSDVTISWDKPSNWDAIRANTDPNNDIVFELVLSSSQTDNLTQPYPILETSDQVFGSFPVEFRRVLYFTSKDVADNGTSLEYTIKGFNLFTGRYFIGIVDSNDPNIVLDSNDPNIVVVDGNNLIIGEENLDNSEGYPTFLLPNTVYYAQMYTTYNPNRDSNNVEDMSDMSTCFSFTTVPEEGLDVPLPGQFRLNKNAVGTNSLSSGPQNINYIELEFDKVSLSWSDYLSDISVEKAIYYDIYMSTTPDMNSFTLIGTTQTEGDVAFTGATDTTSTSITADVSKFTPGTDAYTAFGEYLMPDTTYYFIAKTRLCSTSQLNKTESMFTAILAVTTIKGSVGSPDQTGQRPLSLTDFAVATDPNGNPLMTGTSVTFKWTQLESNIAYVIICSTDKVAVDFQGGTSVSDAVYQSFYSTFGDIYLDPSKTTFVDNFTYNSVSSECTYSIDTWLYPNQLYYFSIQAISTIDNTKRSGWTSIPVTTSTVEAPVLIQAITSPELRWTWSDTGIGVTPQDYTAYIKKSSDSLYNAVEVSNLSIVQDNTVFYGNIDQLDPNTLYDIKVFRGENNEYLICQKYGMKTRDSRSEIEVMWKGLQSDTYQLALKSSNEINYTILSNTDLGKYADIGGQLNAYDTAKSYEEVGTDYYTYYALIKTRPVTKAIGTTLQVTEENLKSNTTYCIKVRTKMVSALDTTIIAYSTYIGPAIIRTDFSAEDEKIKEKGIEDKASLIDSVANLDSSLYWRLNTTNKGDNEILLKEPGIINAMLNSGTSTCTLNIVSNQPTTGSDIIYIPCNILKTINDNNLNLLIKSSGIDYSIGPMLIDLDNSSEIKKLQQSNNVKDVYIELSIKRMAKPTQSLPVAMKSITNAYDFTIQALGITITFADLDKSVNDKLYNTDSGLLNNALNAASNSNGGISLVSQTGGMLTIDGLAGQVMSNLTNYIGDLFKGRNGNSSVISGINSIQSINSRMFIKLYSNTNDGLKFPYILYPPNKAWQQITDSVSQASDGVSFKISNLGRFVILANNVATYERFSNFTDIDAATDFFNKYNISDTFNDVDLTSTDENISLSTLISLYEAVVGKNLNGQSIKKQAKNIGLILDNSSSNNSDRDIEKQEGVYVIMSIYASKIGIKLSNIRPAEGIYIKDESSIESKYLDPIIVSIDMDIVHLKDDGTFGPNDPMTPNELVDDLINLLKISGDIGGKGN